MIEVHSVEIERHSFDPKLHIVNVRGMKGHAEVRFSFSFDNNDLFYTYMMRKFAEMGESSLEGE